MYINEKSCIRYRFVKMHMLFRRFASSLLIPITCHTISADGFCGRAAFRQHLNPVLEVGTASAGVMDQPELSKPALS